MDDSKIFGFSPTKRFDLFAGDEAVIERLGEGAYVLLRTKEGVFEYPTRQSRVFYIGESRSGVSRLSTHRFHAERARAELESDGQLRSYWWPRYGFAAAFGAEVWWFDVPKRGVAKAFESRLVDDFYRSCGSLPIANGKWPNTAVWEGDEGME